MDTKAQTDELQIKTSKTGQEVAVLNGVHLHSIYDPEKEAREFISKHSEILSKKNSALVLGLGLGFHVKEIINKFEEVHGSHYHISVIEPSEKIYQAALTKCPYLNSTNIRVYCDDSIERLYENVELVEFLIHKPAVIGHPASFNLWKKFFSGFLSYKAPEKITQVMANIENHEIVEYLNDLPVNDSLQQLLQHIKKDKARLDQKWDFFFLALDKLTSTEARNNN